MRALQPLAVVFFRMTRPVPGIVRNFNIQTIGPLARRLIGLLYLHALRKLCGVISIRGLSRVSSQDRLAVTRRAQQGTTQSSAGNIQNAFARPMPLAT
jgi:hypothetical protein